MKLLQVTNFFKPSFEAGGVTRVAYSISKYLATNGHEVTIFTTNRSLNNINVETNKCLHVEGMNVYYFENLRKYFPVKIPPIPYYLPFILNRKIQTYDIIHIHEHRSLLAIIVHHYAKKHNIPYVIQPHGSVLPFFQNQSLKKIFDGIFGNRILNDASKLIALTRTEAEQIMKMGIDKGKIEIVPNGIDISEYSDLPKKGTFRRKYLLKDADKVILYLGRLNKIKGIDLLLEAFSSLRHEVNNAKLVIVGPDDGFLTILKKQTCNFNLEDEVLFIDSLYGRDKLEAYVDADVLVYPSNYEIFGLVPFEGIMCNTQTIVTEECGCSEIFKEANCGYIVKYGDINSLTNKIKDCIENPRLNGDVAKSGQQ
ncbi:MAG: glycosyltransferase, partial [Methanolobus sp.]|uniref:glycosyltransferase n=1 Tax=Methanolobus sp. TaxID=1874737 RepID=UPI00272F388C